MEMINSQSFYGLDRMMNPVHSLYSYLCLFYIRCGVRWLMMDDLYLAIRLRVLDLTFIRVISAQKERNNTSYQFSRL